MKCVPLHEPWASLVAKGAKRVETRHWPTPQTILGRRVGVHACATMEHRDLVRAAPFSRYFGGEGELRYGYILCTVVIERCVLMTERNIEKVREEQPEEYAFGLWEPGRYAWILRELEPLAKPVRRLSDWKGQGIFEVPDEALGYLQTGTIDPQIALL